jgi:hemin uptake protein HemP
MSNSPPVDPVAAAASGPASHETPVVDVRALLQGGREVVLLHLGERYRLRITARDRLILTK